MSNKKNDKEFNHPTWLKIGENYVHKSAISRLETKKQQNSKKVIVHVHFKDGGKKKMEFKDWASFGRFQRKLFWRPGRNFKKK